MGDIGLFFPVLALCAIGVHVRVLHNQKRRLNGQHDAVMESATFVRSAYELRAYNNSCERLSASLECLTLPFTLLINTKKEVQNVRSHRRFV